MKKRYLLVRYDTSSVDRELLLKLLLSPEKGWHETYYDDFEFDTEEAALEEIKKRGRGAYFILPLIEYDGM